MNATCDQWHCGRRAVLTDRNGRAYCKHHADRLPSYLRRQANHKNGGASPRRHHAKTAPAPTASPGPNHQSIGRNHPMTADDLFRALRVLAERPGCEHNLNGPCSECGPSLTLDEATAWQQELRDLGVTALPAPSSTTTTTEDEFEAQVIDGLNADDSDLGNRWRFTVPMTLDVTAGSKAEALTLAMRWRDAIGCPDLLGYAGRDQALHALDFDWHLEHPWGC